MPTLQQTILYVSDPKASAQLYEALFERPAKILSPNFAVLVLDSGHQIGFLARNKVEPAAPAGISSELCVVVEDKSTLERLHEAWAKLNAKVILAPQTMYFGGVNFMIEDSDGQRIRVSTPDR